MSQSYAHTIIVGPDESADYNSIQEAINNSSDGDTIEVQLYPHHEQINFHGKAITITSTDPNNVNVAYATTIDGDNAILGIFISGVHKTAAEWWPCIYNTDCFSYEYCAKEDGDCSGIGFCEPRPDDCESIGYAPVCGCDGITYNNSCLAAMANVSVDYEGTCDGGGTDYCLSNADCALGEYCAKEDGDCDGIGICNSLDFFCPLIVYLPVCGCDGVTYVEWGYCGAHWAGVNVDYEGCCDGCCYYLGDFDCDEGVDLYDFSIIASAWLTEPGYARWNPDCDIGFPADNFIDMLDIAVLAENWLEDPLH